jgi:hypothetical protein
MMLKIVCPCGHVGLASAETLPRSLTCWQCGESRRVEVRDCRRIVNRVALTEWLLGEGDAPRAQAVARSVASVCGAAMIAPGGEKGP